MKPSSKEQKQLGAFYTPLPLAQTISDWALRTPKDTMVDPSFGGSVFFSAAQNRLCELGADLKKVSFQLYGVDVDPKAHAQIHSSDINLIKSQLICKNFLSITPGREIPLVDVNIGNPPYVRYQNWDNEGDIAARVGEAAGVKLTKLASLWAPFILHGTRFLKQGGRMGQVLPAEILFAQYARPIIQFLLSKFSQITLVLFDERVFPGALEEVVLLFADGYGEGPAVGVGIVECQTIEDLTSESINGKGQGSLTPELPLLSLLDVKAQKAYLNLEANSKVVRLGDIASVDIGIVTGANSFFVRNSEDIADYGMSDSLFLDIVSKAKDIPGACITSRDIRTLDKKGRPTKLFSATDNTSKKEMATAKNFIADGEELSLDKRYKCRIRSPWWAVPLPKAGIPDAFLTYMNNVFPRFVCNQAKVLSTNTIHGVVLNEDIDVKALSVGFYNSLTLLSAELVGRSYGGGMLKLEPSEAERLLIPPLPKSLVAKIPQVDQLVRTGKIDELANLIDPLVLSPLGLEDDDIKVIRKAREKLCARRCGRSKKVVDT